MKFKFLIIFLVIISIFITACSNSMKPIGRTPPATTPAKVPPSLVVYGKLIDYYQSNGLIVFKIQSEIVHGELNSAYLEVVAKPQKYFGQTKEFLNCLGLKADVELSMLGVYDYSNLEEYLQAKNADEKEIKICKEKILDNLIEKYPECMEIIILDGTKRDYNKWEFNLGCNLKINLIKGNSYVFYFGKRFDEKEPWDRLIVSENLTEYKQEGSWRHENDLIREQMITSQTETGELQPGQTGAVRIFSNSIIPNKEIEINIKLTNKQDVDIPYRISNIKIVDELVWEPNLRQCKENEQEYQDITVPGPVGGESKKVLAKVCSIKSSEQRLQESMLSNCQINYDSSENILPPDSSRIVTFQILCKEPVSCRSWYISEIYGNVSRECSLTLLGDLEFTDELGNVHKKDNFYIRQMLTLSQETFVDVDYSKEISSKDEFYIYVDYKDADGNQIRNAQIGVQFKNLGISGIFTLRYDETLGKYKFRWSDFVEWDPGYRKGTYEFTITAQKFENLMRQETYTFTLR